MRILFLFFCAVSLFAEGGIQGIPPWPNQFGPNLLANGDFETCDDTSWATVGVGGCAVVTVAAGVGGSCGVVTNATNCTTLIQEHDVPAISDAPWIEYSIQAKITHDDGRIFFAAAENTHAGAGSSHLTAFSSEHLNSANERDGNVKLGGDFIEFTELFAVDTNHSGTDHTDFRFSVSGLDSPGVLTVDNAQVRAAWYPLQNFVKYPNNKGYLWSGYDSPLCPGTEVDEACGFVDVRPPVGETLASVYVNILFDTTAGCASPISTLRIDPTVLRTQYDVDASSMTDDSEAHICAELRRDSDDALLAGYPDWKLIQRTESWRTANLEHWIDSYGRWVQGITPRFMNLTYQRGPNLKDCNPCFSTAEADYENWRGPSNGPDYWSDFAKSKRNAVFPFGTWASSHATTALDHFTPLLNVLGRVNTGMFNIATQYFGSIGNGDMVADADDEPTAPTVACEDTGGSISDDFVYAKVAALGGHAELYNTIGIVVSEASLSGHDTTAIVGSAGSCVITPPACSGNKEIGYFYYIDGAATESEPTAADYSRQTSRPIYCGQTVTITEIKDTQLEPPTSTFGSGAGQVLTTSRNAGSWISNRTASTEFDLFDEMFVEVAANPSFIGHYLCDECTAQSAGWLYDMNDYLRVNDPGRLTLGVMLWSNSLPGVNWFSAPVLDISVGDIYWSEQLQPNDLWAQNGLTTGRTANCYGTGGPNTQNAVNNMNLNKVDEWADQTMYATDGSRFSLPVVQQWFRQTSHTCLAFTEEDHRKQMWKAIIATRNWGIVGGVGTWGWLNNQGMHTMARNPVAGDTYTGQGHAEALEADYKVMDEMMNIAHVLIEPIDGSTQLGWGTVLDGAPTSSITLPTATSGSLRRTSAKTRKR